MSVIIVHGCPSEEEQTMDATTRTYDKHWISWVTERLRSEGIETHVPLMPEPWKPEYQRFKQSFETHTAINAHSILVGHSCGCAFLVHWLGETQQQIDTLILVAPWKIAYRSDKSDVDFYGFTIDATIKERVKRIIMFTADDEEDDGKTSLQMYHAALGGSIIELNGHGHYTFGDMGTHEFPELLEAIMASPSRAHE